MNKSSIIAVILCISAMFFTGTPVIFFSLMIPGTLLGLYKTFEKRKKTTTHECQYCGSKKEKCTAPWSCPNNTYGIT